MTEDQYVLTRSELLQLIIAQEELGALESAGVDNWQWYGEDDMFATVFALQGLSEDDNEAEQVRDKALAKYRKDSGGYHAFDELYEHRNALFCLAVNACQLSYCQYPLDSISFWSRKHHDGTMFDGYIIVGLLLDGKWITYHMKDCYSRLLTEVPELDKAPEWDGHKSKDVIQRLSDFLLSKSSTTTCKK